MRCGNTHARLAIQIITDQVPEFSFVLSFIPGGDQVLTTQAPALINLQVMPGIVNSLISLLGVFNFVNWGWLTGLLFLAVLSLAYVGWLASWWAHSQQSLA